jgi:hypothetical protein
LTPNRRYYLIGRGTSDPTRFAEAKYPGRTFKYPIVEDASDRTDASLDRAYIEVAEYYQVEPEWTAFHSAHEINAAFDVPMLHAHRFVTVGVSRGEDEINGDLCVGD